MINNIFIPTLEAQRLSMMVGKRWVILALRPIRSGYYVVIDGVFFTISLAVNVGKARHSMVK